MWSWLAIGLSGMYSVLGAKQANPTQSLVFKIFTLLLLLILVLTQGPSADHSYWIAGGLVVSMFADTLHSFKTRKLIYFAAYLAAQVCYTRSASVLQQIFLGSAQWRYRVVVVGFVACRQYRGVFPSFTAVRFARFSRSDYGHNASAARLGSR